MTTNLSTTRGDQFFFTNEFTPSNFPFEIDEIKELLFKLEKKEFIDGKLVSNIATSLIDSYLLGHKKTGFKNFQKFLQAKFGDNIPLRIAIENYYKKKDFLNYYREVVAKRLLGERIDQDDLASSDKITLVDIINEVNTVCALHKIDSAQKSTLVKFLIEQYRVDKTRILSSNEQNNNHISRDDLDILPSSFKELLLEKLIAKKLKQQQQFEIEDNISEILRSLGYAMSVVDVQRKDDGKTIEMIKEKIFVELIASQDFRLNQDKIDEYRQYFESLDYNAQFKIFSRVWDGKDKDKFLGGVNSTFLLLLKKSDEENLADIAFRLLLNASQNLKFEDFKKVVDAFCDYKLVDDTQSQIENLVVKYLIPIITKASPIPLPDQDNKSLRFLLAKEALNNFSFKSDTEISFEAFRQIIEAIESQGNKLTSQQFQELCEIYKKINDSQEFRDYALLREAPRVSSFNLQKFSGSLRSYPEQLSSATLSKIKKEVSAEIIEAKIINDLSKENLESDLCAKLFNQLSIVDEQIQGTRELDFIQNFIEELKDHLASNQDIKIADLKNILFYSDRYLKKMGVDQQEISSHLIGLIVFCSDIKLTSVDVKEQKLLDDLLLSYNPDSLNTSNPLTQISALSVSSRKFNYLLEKELSPDNFLLKLSNTFLTQDEITILARLYIKEGRLSSDNYRDFISQVTELVCGSQNQLSKLKYKKALLKLYSSKAVGNNNAFNQQVLNYTKQLETDLFFNKEDAKYQATQQLQSVLDFANNHRLDTYQYENFKRGVSEVLDMNISLGINKERLLALKYVVANTPQQFLPMLQNSLFELAISDQRPQEQYDNLVKLALENPRYSKTRFAYGIELEDIVEEIQSPRMRFLVGCIAVIEKQYKNTQELLEDISAIFGMDRTLDNQEKKLYTDILLTSKIIQNQLGQKTPSKDFLENLRSNILASLEIDQQPRLDPLTIQTRQQINIPESVDTQTCCSEFISGLRKYASSAYQYICDSLSQSNYAQNLNPKQVSKLKIIEFVNQMKGSDFEEVITGVAVQLARLRDLNFQEKADLVIKSILTYQSGKNDNISTIKDRILTGLRVCSMDPRDLNQQQLEALSTILYSNKITADVGKNYLFLSGFPDSISHQGLMNDIYSPDYSQLLRDSTVKSYLADNQAIVDHQSRPGKTTANLVFTPENRQHSIHQRPRPQMVVFGPGQLAINASQQQDSPSPPPPPSIPNPRRAGLSRANTIATSDAREVKKPIYSMLA